MRFFLLFSIYFFLLLLCSSSVVAQMNATFTTTVNTICNGEDCEYNGPSILINEMMMSPSVNDGSLWSPNCSNSCGEWIELYNPNLCEPVDVSCYFLGSNAIDGVAIVPPPMFPPFYNEVAFPEGFVIPQGTIIPPSGFLILRGVNAPSVPANLLVANGGKTIEIVLQNQNMCLGGGNRFWFPNGGPNGGGWFAFYNAAGVPQDAVSWGNPVTAANSPCVPVSSCGFSGVLPSYNQIPANRKTNVYGILPDSWGQSIRRGTDGGAWLTNQGSTNSTPGTCNAACIPSITSTCDGTAMIHVTGGTAPYHYSWNDSQAQLTQTASGLCDGTYVCTVTDAANVVQTFQVVIVNFVPTVSMSIQEEVCINGPIVTPTGSPAATNGALGVFTGNGISSGTFNAATAGLGVKTITYTYTDIHGCTNFATDDILVNPLPVVSITNIETYCSSLLSANLQFSPIGGQLSGQGVSNNQFHPSTVGVGNYVLTYTYTDTNGCSNSTSETVSVVAGIAPVITAPQTICIAANDITIQVTPSGGQFQVDGVNASLVFSPQDYGLGVHTLSYSYTDANGCSGDTSQTILITSTLYETDDVTICSNLLPYTWHGQTLTAGGVGVATYTFQNSYGCDVVTTLNLTVNPTDNVVVNASICSNLLPYNWHGQTIIAGGMAVATFVSQNSNGCNVVNTLNLTILPVANADFTVQAEKCIPAKIVLTPLSMDATSTYNWYLNGVFVSNSQVYSDVIVHAGCYTIKLVVTNSNGCTSELIKNEAFCIDNTPDADFYFTEHSPGAQITNTSSGAVTYLWNLPTGNSTVFEPSITFNFEQESYRVTLYAYSANGCVDSITKVITPKEDVIFYVPNTFTPDGNEYNNTFGVVIASGIDVFNFSLMVFNRWGEKIWESFDPYVFWDGTYVGKVVQDDTYVWKLVFKEKENSNQHQYSGHINLIR